MGKNKNSKKRKHEDESGEISKKHAKVEEGRIDETEKREAERRDRMARLRAENEAEEKRIVELQKPTEKVTAKESIVEVNQDDLEGLDEMEQMQKLMGFGGFGTTKGQKVEENHTSSAKGAAAKNKARQYRQYMNRKNGFNRPLDKMN